MSDPSKATTAVVIPVYNRPIRIFRALKSVVRQVQPPDQVMIVDDGSTDDTPAKIDHWCETTPTPFTKQLLRTKHAGAAAARNRGIASLMNCDFVLFLDSDDEIPPDFFIRTVPLLLNNEKMVAVSVPRLMMVAGTPIFHDMKKFNRDPIRWMFLRGGGIASCSLFRLPMVKSVGGFDEDITSGHDLSLFARVAQQGLWRVLEGAPSVIYRKEDNMNEDANLSEHFTDRYVDWARVREDIWYNLLSNNVKEKAFYVNIMATLWYAAALNKDKAGDPRQAIIYYIKMLKYSLATLRLTLTKIYVYLRIVKVMLLLPRAYLKILYTRVS